MKIHIHKTGVMHFLLRHLSSGYTEYTTGIVEASKILRLAEKFRDIYKTDLNKDQRRYRKQKGKGNALFICYPSKDGLQFQFFLLLSPGEHPMRQSEKLRDATKKRQRLTFDDGSYEAIVLPRSGGVKSWTWRMTAPKLRDVDATVSELIRVKRSLRGLKEYIAVIEKMPSFRGMRQQVSKIRFDAAKEWKRINRPNKDITFVPHSGYIRHQKYPEISLELVVERMLAGKKPMHRDWRYSSDHGGSELLSLPKKKD